MIDIVYKLRHPAWSWSQDGGSQLDKDETLIDLADAADEIERLRSVPAQTQQEPVAWRVKFKGDSSWILYYSDPRNIENEGRCEYAQPLYLAPAQTQPSPVVEDARHEVANWMIGEGYVTGHGDTLDDLIQELVTQAQQAVLAGAAQGTPDAIEAAQFLLERLDEFDPGEDDAEREYHGHVAPAIARLRSALGGKP